MFSRESQLALKGDAEDGHFTSLGGQRTVKKAGSMDSGRAWQTGHGFNTDRLAEQHGLQKRGENRDFATYANHQTGENLTVHKASEKFIYDSPQQSGPKIGYIEDLGSTLGAQNSPNGQQSPNGQISEQAPKPSGFHSASQDPRGNFIVQQSHSSAEKAQNSPTGTHVLQPGKDGQWQATPKAGGKSVTVPPAKVFGHDVQKPTGSPGGGTKGQQPVPENDDESGTVAKSDGGTLVVAERGEDGLIVLMPS